MTQWTLYWLDTGRISTVLECDEETALRHAGESRGVLEGAYNGRTHRFDTESGIVVEREVVDPQWRQKLARIHEVEQQSMRALREALLDGDAGAMARLRDADAEISELRGRLSKPNGGDRAPDA